MGEARRKKQAGYVKPGITITKENRKPIKVGPDSYAMVMAMMAGMKHKMPRI